MGTYKDRPVQRMDLGGSIGATSSKKKLSSRAFGSIHDMFAGRAHCDFINF